VTPVSRRSSVQGQHEKEHNCEDHAQAQHLRLARRAHENLSGPAVAHGIRRRQLPVRQWRRTDAGCARCSTTTRPGSRRR
jgi:hypothetical protein